MIRFRLPVLLFLLLTVSSWAQESLLGRKIVTVEFRGNRKVESDAMKVAIASKIGSTLDAPLVREDIRALWRLGYFSDVQVTAKAVGQGVGVVYTVVEKPTIRSIFVSGNESIELTDINKQVEGVKPGDIIDVTKIQKDRKAIEDHYIEEGYFLAQVRYEVQEANEREVDVLFKISEGKKVTVKNVRFVGNRAVPDSTLRKVMETRAESALSFVDGSGKFNQEAFERDMGRMTAYYFDHGHINVSIGTPQVELSADRRDMFVSIPINEGDVFTIGEVGFKGDVIGKETALYKILNINQGEMYVHSKVRQAIERVQNVYRNQGYAAVQVTPLNETNPEKKTVGLILDIKKGEKVYFERINIRGNDKTADKVIRREMKISEGELYHHSDLEVSRRRVEALGFFANVEISTKRGSSDEFMEVNVEVTERPTGSFQIGAGFSSVENFIANAQIQQQNLFGRGQTVSLQAQLSSLRQQIFFSFSERSFMDSKWRFGFQVYKQRLDSLFLTRDALGGSVSFGYPLSYEQALSVRYKLEDVDVEAGSQGFTSFGGVRTEISSQAIANLYRGGVTSSVRLSYTWDSRNDRLYRPSKGWFHTVFAEFADKATGSELIYTRYGAESRFYQKLWGPFILKLRGDVGMVTSRDPLGVPIGERYLLGGIFDIRGYQPRTLGPRLLVGRPGEVAQSLQPWPIGGNLQLVFNSEVEFPLVKALQIYGVVFLDLGNSYNLEDRYCSGTAGANQISIKFDPCFDLTTSLIDGARRSTGFGFRWISPLGPLRFEWGIPLDRQPGEDSLVFEFTIGNFF